MVQYRRAQYRSRWSSMLALAMLAGGQVCDARAGDAGPDVGVQLRAGWFGSSRDLDEREDPAFVSGELSFKQPLGDDQRLEFKVRALSEDAFGGRARTRIDWLQAMWFVRTERVDLRIGRQKIRWGKADGINPSDFFTAVDYTVLLPLEDDRYLAVPAVRADIHLDDTNSLSLVAANGFTPTRIPWPRPSPVPVREDRPDGWQVGARWLHTGERLDWSLSVFHGRSTLPLLSAPSDGSPALLRHYAWIDGIGADVARNFGSVGFRAEAACQRPRTESGRMSVASSCKLVAGVDRAFDRWNVNLQGVFQVAPGRRESVDAADPARRFAATQNAILHGQQHRTQFGVTTRIAADWRHDSLKTELLLVANASPYSVFARPMLTWAVNDRTTLRAGYEYYAGGDATYFGALKRNRTGFLEWQLSY